MRCVFVFLAAGAALLLATPCAAQQMPARAVGAANFRPTHPIARPPGHFHGARVRAFARFRPYHYAPAYVEPGYIEPPVGYDYGYGGLAPAYRTPARMAAPSAPIEIQRRDGDAASPSSAPWYYCRASNAYYPAARDCAAGWEMVAPDAGAQFLSELRRN